MFFPGHYFSFWKLIWEFVDTHVMRESIQEWSEVVFWNNRAHLGRYFPFAEFFSIPEAHLEPSGASTIEFFLRK